MGKLKYLSIACVVMLLSMQNLQAQIEIKIMDLNGHGISNCHLISTVNQLVFESDDSGFIRITKPFESDTFQFRHINFKSKRIFISKETSNSKIKLDFDTMQFKGFVVKGVNCDESKNMEVKREYGYEVDKKKAKFGGDCAVLYINSKVAKSFVLDNSCGNLVEISFFVPRIPEINKDIQSYYNLNIYIVTKDSAFNIPSWKLISTIDLRKVKYGWNKISVNDCSFKTKQITIGMDVTLKSNDSLNAALLHNQIDVFPLCIRTENRGESNSFVYIDYSFNNIPSEVWRTQSRSLAIKIKTKEFE